MNNTLGRFVTAAALALSTHAAYATTYSLPPDNQALIGKLDYVITSPTDTVVVIQKNYNVGFNALANANPHEDLLEPLNPETTLVIPTQHILPNQPRTGIVINLPEMRMYYYPPDSGQVLTYPIGIGKINKMIPITHTAITKKVENPVWIPPADIREYNLQQGIVLPKIMPAGPENPLGPYAIYMRVPTYLIHSTIFPESIGKRASFGCIRMYESDIKEFFPTVAANMPVAIINTPVKVGWEDNRLYIEAYPALEEHHAAYDTSLPGMVHSIYEETSKTPLTLVDWQLIAFLNEERDGIPHEVATRLR